MNISTYYKQKLV